MPKQDGSQTGNRKYWCSQNTTYQSKSVVVLLELSYKVKIIKNMKTKETLFVLLSTMYGRLMFN